MPAFSHYIALVRYGGFRTSLPRAVRTVGDWAQVALSFVALVRGWRVQRRDHHKKLLDPQSPDQARQAERDETRRSTGLAVAFTVREYPGEMGARRALERAHHLPGNQKRLR